jgi:hypothetical protein
MAKIFFGLFAFFPVPIWACSCAVSPVQYCQKAPDANNLQQAVFVGTVNDFYPTSHEQMNELWDQFYQTHPEFRLQPGNRTGRRIAGAAPDNQEFRREFIRFLWGDSLTAVEQEQLRNADERELNRLMFDYRRRARFHVLENFSNAESPEFELVTNLDGPSCGFDFIEGSPYLVEAHRNGTDGRWKVDSCSPPRLVTDAPDEVRALRAWKAGQQPKARISGFLFSRTGQQSPAGITLQLLSGVEQREAVSDSGGQFEFQDLPLANYLLRWGFAPAQTRSIDLTRAWCARVLSHHASHRFLRDARSDERAHRV